MAFHWPIRNSSCCSMELTGDEADGERENLLIVRTGNVTEKCQTDPDQIVK